MKLFAKIKLVCFILYDRTDMYARYNNLHNFHTIYDNSKIGKSAISIL